MSAPFEVFPACANAEAQQFREMLDLSDSFMCTPGENERTCSAPDTMELMPGDGELTLNVNRVTLIEAQKNAFTLYLCASTAAV